MFLGANVDMLAFGFFRLRGFACGRRAWVWRSGRLRLLVLRRRAPFLLLPLPLALIRLTERNGRRSDPID